MNKLNVIFKIICFFVSLWLFNLAIVSSYFGSLRVEIYPDSLSLRSMVRYINFGSAYHLIFPKEQGLEELLEQDGKKLEYRTQENVKPEDKNKFEDYVFDRYMRSILEENEITYNDYINIVDPKGNSQIRLRNFKDYPKSELYEKYKLSYTICKKINNLLINEFKYLKRKAIYFSPRCEYKLISKYDVSKIVKSAFDAAFKPIVSEIQGVILSNKQINFSKKHADYSSLVSLRNFDISLLSESCESGLELMCRWIEDSRYLLTFSYLIHHEGTLKVNNGEIGLDLDMFFSRINHSVLLEASPNPSEMIFSIIFDRNDIFDRKYISYAPNTVVTLSVKPLIPQMESILSESRIDHFSVDISATTKERIFRVFGAVLSSLPHAVTAIISLLNMIFIIILLFKGNLSSLKKVIFKQAQHDID